MKKTMRGRRNLYTCSKCGRTVLTVDKDEGVTPFMIRCRSAETNCRGEMYSSFYQVPPEFDTEAPKFEWFRPKDLKALSRGESTHVKNGGLLIRPISSGGVKSLQFQQDRRSSWARRRLLR